MGTGTQLVMVIVMGKGQVMGTGMETQLGTEMGMGRVMGTGTQLGTEMEMGQVMGTVLEKGTHLVMGMGTQLEMAMDCSSSSSSSRRFTQSYRKSYDARTANKTSTTWKCRCRRKCLAEKYVTASDDTAYL
jgi:hypothetical protein